MQNKELLRVHGPAYVHTHLPRCKSQGDAPELAIPQCVRGSVP
jgi:phage FluMu protein Com